MVDTRYWEEGSIQRTGSNAIHDDSRAAEPDWETVAHSIDGNATGPNTIQRTVVGSIGNTGEVYRERPIPDVSHAIRDDASKPLPLAIHQKSKLALVDGGLGSVNQEASIEVLQGNDIENETVTVLGDSHLVIDDFGLQVTRDAQETVDSITTPKSTMCATMIITSPANPIAGHIPTTHLTIVEHAIDEKRSSGIEAPPDGQGALATFPRRSGDMRDDIKATAITTTERVGARIQTPSSEQRDTNAQDPNTVAEIPLLQPIPKIRNATMASNETPSGVRSTLSTIGNIDGSNKQKESMQTNTTPTAQDRIIQSNTNSEQANSRAPMTGTGDLPSAELRDNTIKPTTNNPKNHSTPHTPYTSPAEQIPKRVIDGSGGPGKAVWRGQPWNPHDIVQQHEHTKSPTPQDPSTISKGFEGTPFSDTIRRLPAGHGMYRDPDEPTTIAAGWLPASPIFEHHATELDNSKQLRAISPPPRNIVDGDIVTVLNSFLNQMSVAEHTEGTREIHGTEMNSGVISGEDSVQVTDRKTLAKSYPVQSGESIMKPTAPENRLVSPSH